MISTFDNCLFVHIPKAAGQSVESVFLQRAGLSWQQREPFLLRPNSNPKLGPPRLAHLTAEEYIKLGYIDKATFAAMYKFTIVRNPWDRLVSEYLYKGHSYSFKDFLFKHFPKKGQDDYVNFEGIYRHVMPQAEFIFDQNDCLLVDFIGRFESINQDFADISRQVCNQALPLPHKNKTKKQRFSFRLFSHSKTNKMHYSDYYDAESKEAVTLLYQRDINLLHYEFEQA